MLQRSSTFAVDRTPIPKIAKKYGIDLTNTKTTGPFTCVNPTRTHLMPGEGDIAKWAAGLAGSVTSQTVQLESIESSSSSGANKKAEEIKDDDEDEEDRKLEEPAESVQFIWTSRNNRKGRHQLGFVPAPSRTVAKYLVPEPTSAPREVLKNIARMLTDYPVWDISWVVAYIFVWGSIIWVINAFFVWLPLQNPSTEFTNEVYIGGGITAFIGATVFEIGSVLLMLEAINENRSGCFGWAVEKLIEGGSNQFRIFAKKDACEHHHVNRGNFVGKSAKRKGLDDNENRSNNFSKKGSSRSWTWYPSWEEFTTHYIFEIGFLACSSQLFGASIFWISGFTALPGIYNHLSWPAQKGVYLAPQIIGGSGFIVSGTLFMIETQEVWWKPAPHVLGWHVGLWNLIGGIGFTLCPIFGFYAAESWGEYESCLATFWGSWAFLLASLAQHYESLQKNPVSVLAIQQTVTSAGEVQGKSNAPDSPESVPVEAPESEEDTVSTH